MKKSRKISIIATIFLIVLLFNNVSYATIPKAVKKSEAYENYMKLSEEEKKGLILPFPYEVKIKRQKYNPLKMARMGNSALPARFSLLDVVPENVVVRNQGQTNFCWAFASNSTLETSIALKDKKDGKEAVPYDFSDRHIAYGSTRDFLNGKINEDGMYKVLQNGGNPLISFNYYTNGMGAIAEKDMPHEDNTNIIDMSEIQNKKVISTVKDYKLFPSAGTDQEKEELKKLIKYHVKNYGAVTAAMSTGNQFGEEDRYNNETGAFYLERIEQPDHLVSIVGWDDNYPVEKFVQGHRPQNPGAWIVKNSWGTEERHTIAEVKEMIYEANKTDFNSQGISSPEEIPNDSVIEYMNQIGYIYEPDKNEFYMNIGDKGFIYISYEDKVVSQNYGGGMFGIIDANYGKNYENIYQYDNSPAVEVYRTHPSMTELYMAVVFDKKGKETEYIKDVSYFSVSQQKVKVYINPNNSNLNKNELKPVKLKQGEYVETIEGFNTIELAEPIKINGNSFAIALNVSEIGPVYWTGEIQMPNVCTPKIETNRSFMTAPEEFEQARWTDMGKESKVDLKIKAHTINIETTGMEISKAPNKTEYVEGENFDQTGMVVSQITSTGDKIEIPESEYVIKNGTGLKAGQTSVEIAYKNYTAEQPITVTAKATDNDNNNNDNNNNDNNNNTESVIKEIKITKLPNKTEYLEGEDFDPKGMEVTVTFDDGATKVITDYEIENGKSLKKGQDTVIIKYKGLEAIQKISVKTTEIVKPKNTNYNNANGKVIKTKGMVFSDPTIEEYILSEIEISNIVKPTTNDKMEYYYYLSSSPKEQSIKDWVKIANMGEEEEKYSFEVNTKDMKNLEDLMLADDLYIYIKEVATKDGIQSEEISKSILLDSSDTIIENYLDGVKKDVSELPTPPEAPENNKTPEVEDDTKAEGIIPHAGKGFMVILSIISIIAISKFLFDKYKNIQIK